MSFGLRITVRSAKLIKEELILSKIVPIRATPVSDHCLIRYMERVRGLNLDQYRHEILCACHEGLKAGAAVVHHGGASYFIEKGKITTIMSTREQLRNDTQDRGWRLRQAFARSSS